MRMRMWLLAAVMFCVVSVAVSAYCYPGWCNYCGLDYLYYANCTCTSYSDPGCDDTTCFRKYGILNWTVNPCVTANLNFSTPVVVTLQAVSYKQKFSTGWYGTYNIFCHNVSLRAILYYGEPAIEQEYEWVSVLQWWSHSFNFTANHSGTHSLLVQAKFVGVADWESQIINFTVAADGDNNAANSVYGDCVSYYGQSTENLQVNALYISLNVLPYWSRSILWIFLTLGVVGAAWFGMEKAGGFKKVKLAVLCLVTFFMLLIGAISRVTGWEYVGIIFVGIAAYLGIKIAKYFTGGGER